ncbi:MAG: response regulator [Pseudomonadota bacterium]
MIKIQLVDDEPHILKALSRVLGREGLEVHAFTDIEEALAALGEHHYAVILVDFKMPQINGVTYLQFAKQSQPDAVRIVISAFGDRQTMMDAINLAEVYRFLSKPWEDYEITAAIRSAIDLYSLRTENRRLLLQVNAQQLRLRAQEEELQRLEQENPGLTRVERDPDGHIIIDSLADRAEAPG